MALMDRLSRSAGRLQHNPGKIVITILLVIAFAALIGRAF